MNSARFPKMCRAQICPHSKAATFPKTRKIKEACRASTGWMSSFIRSCSCFSTLDFAASLSPPSLHLPCLDGTSPPGTSDPLSLIPPQQDAAAAFPKEEACSIQMILPSVSPYLLKTQPPTQFHGRGHPSVNVMCCMCGVMSSGAR